MSGHHPRFVNGELNSHQAAMRQGTAVGAELKVDEQLCLVTLGTKKGFSEKQKEKSSQFCPTGHLGAIPQPTMKPAKGNSKQNGAVGRGRQTDRQIHFL